MFFNFFSLNALNNTNVYDSTSDVVATFIVVYIAIILVCLIVLVIGLKLIYSGYFNDQPVKMIIGVILTSGWIGLAMLAILHMTCQDKKLKYQAAKKLEELEELEEESLQQPNRKMNKMNKMKMNKMNKMKMNKMNKKNSLKSKSKTK